MIVAGSVLYLLCFHTLGETPLKNLQTCWKFLLESYKELGITERYRGMRKLTMFCKKKGGPKLKGRAAQVQNIARPLLALWEKYMSPHLEIRKKIRTLLKINVAEEKLLSQNLEALAFNAEDSKDFQQLCFAAAQLHMDLAQHFKDEEKPLFQDIPKIHPVLHSALASGYLNPRLTWCFRQEDNMNVHRTLAKSCCKGLQGPLVTAKMVAKLRIAMHLQLSKM